ncbi:MAG: phosphoenolpyruvate--protein phosphotransferase [Spirochaetaceae bacterium]|nr:phosphoenolpyruvate--protein phosphotransferase [Spirochaetaceae bacterium]
MILKGKGVSPGAAVGKIFLYKPFSVEVEESFLADGADPEEEIARYGGIKAAAAGEVTILRDRLEKEDPERAKIFTAHLDILDDPEINEKIKTGIISERRTAPWSVWKSYETFIRMLKKAKNALIAERAADFEDVRKRLLRLWFGAEKSDLASLDEELILAARDLLPSDTASLDKNKVLAVITETGGETSHSAIIAKSCGIPAVLGIPGLLDCVRSGQLAAVDADEGSVLLDPDEASAAAYKRREERFREDRKTAAAFRGREAFTADRVRVDIGLNIAGAGDLDHADYADSVGLFRTEFLYMGRDTLPSEEEQFVLYRKVLERFGKRPVTLRTLDIGGDKTLTSMKLPREDNPFLGSRALRLCFSHPEIFRTQIRASLRSSVYGELWLMLPMVGSLDDIREAKECIRRARRELESEGCPCGSFKTGIMIEIPSIALVAEEAAAEVDFASIGSNDLCQYLCAADRMNPAVAGYYQSCHPGLFRLIGETVKAFAGTGKPLCICGELGGDPLAVPALVGLGMRKLSMGAAALGRVKRTLAGFTLAQAEELARRVLRCATAAEVERQLEQFARRGGNGER